jgi:hypothetical protein
MPKYGLFLRRFMDSWEECVFSGVGKNNLQMSVNSI